MVECNHPEESFVLIGNALVCEACEDEGHEVVETTGVYPAYIPPQPEPQIKPCRPLLVLVVCG